MHPIANEVLGHKKTSMKIKKKDHFNATFYPKRVPRNIKALCDILFMM